MPDLLSVFASPYAFHVYGGLSAFVTVLLKDALAETYETRRQRLLDAALAGIATTSLIWLAWRFFPERVAIQDTIPLGICIAFVGVSKTFKAAAKKMGFSLEDQP